MNQEIFELNEAIKEVLVKDLNCFKAVTFYRTGTIGLIDDPFFETEAHWKSEKEFHDLTNAQARQMGKELFKLRNKLKDMGGMLTGPLFETHPKSFVMVWGLFDKLQA